MADDTVYKKVDIVNPDNEIVVTSTNIHAAGDRMILRGSDFRLLPHYSTVELIGYQEEGIVKMTGVITLSIEKQVNIDIIEVGSQHDRREYLKIKTDAEATIRKAFTGPRSGKYFLINEKIRLRDISIGGICFFSNKVFLLDQIVYLDLHEIRGGLAVKAQILRKKRESGVTGFRYRYGCKFIDLDNVNQQIICGYVFKTELDIHQKEIEKGLDDAPVGPQREG